MDCSILGFPVLHHLPELAQTHVHWVYDAIQPSHPLLPTSSPALNLSQHQSLCQWVGSVHAAAAAKSLQSCPTLCDPIYRSPPGSPVPGILLARILKWVAISFSNAWKWKVKSLSHVRLLVTPWTVAYQAPLSMGFSRQEYWSVALCIGGQNFGALVLASVLPLNIQGWFPLGSTGLVCLPSKELSKVVSSTTVQKHQFFGAQPSLCSNFHIHTWLLEKQ